MNESRRWVDLFSTSIRWTCHEEHAYANFFGAETRVHQRETESLRCDRCMTHRRDTARADELRRTRTWHGATRLAAREELMGRAPTQTYPTAPFQPTRPNDRPNRRWSAGTNTIPVPVSPAPPQPPAAIPLPLVDLSTCIPVYPWTYPRSGSTRLGSCRVRHLSDVLFICVSTFFSSSWSHECLYCVLRDAITVRGMTSKFVGGTVSRNFEWWPPKRYCKHQACRIRYLRARWHLDRKAVVQNSCW